MLVWPAVDIDLRQPFPSPCLGVMGFGRNLKTVDKDQGSNIVEHSLFSSLTILGRHNPFGPDSRYLVAFAISLLIYPLRMARRFLGTIDVKRALAADKMNESASRYPLSLCKDCSTMLTVDEESTIVAMPRHLPGYSLRKYGPSIAIVVVHQGKYRRESCGRNFTITNNCRNSD